MRHQKIKKMLSELVDGRLSSNDKNMVKKHLEHCSDCQNTLKSFQKLGRLYNERNFKLNPFFAQRVLATLNARRTDGFWQVFDFIPRPVIVTGLVFSILILSIFATPLYHLRDENSEPVLTMLYVESETMPVTDDQALAIIMNTQETDATGE